MPPVPVLDKSKLATALAQWDTLPSVLVLVAATGLVSWLAWCKLLRSRTAVSTRVMDCQNRELKWGVVRDAILHHKTILRSALDAVDRFIWNVELSKEPIGQWFRLLAGGYVLSVLSHLCILTAHWVMLRALGIEVTPVAAIWLVLAVTLSLLFPIAINGLGVREAMYVTVLSAYGVTSTPALLAALLTRLVAVLFGLLGGAGLLLGTPSAKPAGG
jgi:uncharacterized membrane protein YbhN (UPF0104 family)